MEGKTPKLLNGKKPLKSRKSDSRHALFVAKEMAQQLLKRHPKFSLSSFNLARTYKNPEDSERLLNALRKAGLPD